MKKILAFLLAILLIAGLAACGTDAPVAPTPEPETPTPEATPEPTPEPQETEENRVPRAAFITYSVSNESQAFAWSEFQRLAPEYGFEVYLFAGENDSAIEVADIEQAIAEGFDAIFVSSGSIEAILPALRRAKEAGIIVGMFNTELPEEHRDVMDFFVGSDDYMIGELVGQFASDHFPDGANFVEVGGPADRPATTARHEGFRSGIADNIVELGAQNVFIGWNAPEAFVIMEDFIDQFGNDIDIVFCHWDEGVAGVIEALQNAGMDDVFVVGIGVDGLGTAEERIRAGTQALSIDQNLIITVRASLENARIMLEGGTVLVDNWVPADMMTFDTIHNVTSGPNW